MQRIKTHTWELIVSALQAVYLAAWARWVRTVDPSYFEEDETIQHAYVRMIKDVERYVQ